MAKSRNNPVAKFSRRFNKAITMVDRKRELKKTGDLGRRCNYDDDFYDSAGDTNPLLRNNDERI